MVMISQLLDMQAYVEADYFTSELLLEKNLYRTLSIFAAALFP